MRAGMRVVVTAWASALAVVATARVVPVPIASAIARAELAARLRVEVGHRAEAGTPGVVHAAWDATVTMVREIAINGPAPRPHPSHYCHSMST